MHSIPFSPPDISDIEIQEVIDTLKSGWITTGPKTKALEKQIADFCHTPRAVALNSGTAAMELALFVLGIGPGDEVIVPAYTYSASAAVIHHTGAKIIMVDSQPNAIEMDYNRVAQAITHKTKAIIPVDIAGRLCDYKTLFQIVDEKKHLFSASSKLQSVYNRIVLLADSAHAFGATRRIDNEWLHAGEIADLTAFSFHAVKSFTTSEGGALTWKETPGIDNEDLYGEIYTLGLHGQSKDALSKSQIGDWEYDIIYPGFKNNMPDVLASIGLGQMKRFPDLLIRRKELINRYEKNLNDLNIDTYRHFSDEFTSAGHLFMIRVNGFELTERNQFIAAMGERGIACNVHYKPLPMMTAYRNLGFDIADYPNAYALYENEVTLPLHTRLTDLDVDYICDAIHMVMSEIKK